MQRAAASVASVPASGFNRLTSSWRAPNCSDRLLNFSVPASNALYNEASSFSSSAVPSVLNASKQRRATILGVASADSINLANSLHFIALPFVLGVASRGASHLMTYAGAGKAPAPAVVMLIPDDASAGSDRSKSLGSPRLTRQFTRNRQLERGFSLESRAVELGRSNFGCVLSTSIPRAKRILTAVASCWRPIKIWR